MLIAEAKDVFNSDISLGNILTIVSFFVGGVGFAWSIKSDTKVLDFKYTIIDAQIDDFKVEIKKLAEVIANQTLHGKRIDLVEERVLAQGKRLDETEKRVNLYADTPVYEGTRRRGS